MSSKPAAIPLFGDAYMADTRHLTLEEHGAYLMLLIIAWRTDECSLPDDDKRIARMLGIGQAKWERLKPTIMAFWTLENGAWYQGRLTRERKFVDEKRATNSLSAKARWGKQEFENKQGAECERISERNAPPPSPPQEKVPIANAIGGKAAPSASEITKSVWDTGKAILKAAGHDDRQAGSIIGRFRKTYSDSQVLIALSRCQIEQPSEPLEWLTKALEFENGKNIRASGGNGPDKRSGIAKACDGIIAGEFREVH